MHPLLLVSGLAALLFAGEAAHVIPPGHERALRAVLVPQVGELLEGEVIHALRPLGDRVEALYGPRGAAPTTCESAPVCLVLAHPTLAAPDDRVAGGFTIRVRGRASPRLVDGVAARLAGAGLAGIWRATEGPPAVAEAPADDALTPGDAGAESRFRALLDTDDGLAAAVQEVQVEPDRVAFRLRLDDASPHASLTVFARSPGHGIRDEVTPRFSLVYDPTLARQPSWRARIHAAVSAADDGSLTLLSADTEAPSLPSSARSCSSVSRCSGCSPSCSRTSRLERSTACASTASRSAPSPSAPR